MSRYFICIFLATLCICCKDRSEEKQDFKLSEEFKAYWYAGEAEITSYDLEQARYGEIRKGEAVLIYVTEDFLPGEQVKANSNSPENISVLKLNSTKKFITGIYPYSIMQSSFYPLNGQEHALKISASIQEWCGQVYMQMNNKKDFQISSHSYFQGEADQEFNIQETALENEVWNRIRINPDQLPAGELEMIPSFEYLRLSHKEIKPYNVIAEFYTIEDLNVYKLHYPDLERTLKIYYSRTFPYTIEKWEESYPSGFGEDQKILTSKAVKKKQIKIDYWNRNSNKNLPLRENLDLQ